MSNYPQIDYTRISPNKSSRKGNAIRKITPHYCACDASLEGLGNGFAAASRRASSNYGIDKFGRVGLFVPEEEAAWTSSNLDNDRQAVTIEVANFPDSSISQAAWDRLIDLCVDVCRRNGIPGLTWTGDATGTLTVHRFFADTSCPGQWLFDRMPLLAAEVNARLQAPPEPAPIVWQPITVDGWWGRETSLRLKQIIAATWWPWIEQNDRIDHQWYENRQAACTGGWGYDRTLAGDDAIRCLQALTGQTQDGIWGPETCRSVQYQLGTVVDGVLDGPSPAVRKLQENMCRGFLWVPRP